MPVQRDLALRRQPKHGLVERRGDPKDRRVRRLHLLPSANPILEEISAYREALNEQLVDGLDEPARTKLIDTLIFMKTKLSADNTPADKMQMAGE